MEMIGRSSARSSAAIDVMRRKILCHKLHEVVDDLVCLQRGDFA